MHKSRLGAIIVDCHTEDLYKEAQFWSAALGRTAESSGEQSNQKYVRLEGDGDVLPILFQQVEHDSRVHIDIETDDIPSEVKRLETLGAEVINEMPKWTVMQAPSGHRSCVVSPQRNGFDQYATTWE